MKFSVRRPTALDCIAMAAMLTIATGCASTPRQVTAPAAAASRAGEIDETPASGRSLVDTLNLTTAAEEQGYKPEVHDGAVIYCWTDAETGSSIPTKKCVNQDQMREMLLQSQQQRQDIQRKEASQTSCPAVSC